MKKNMIYIATGIVFLIFAVCIAYVFTEPAQTPQKQEAALTEQDASQLTALNTEEPKTPSADALVFTAQENTQAITTPPPAETEELTNSSLSSDTAFTHPAGKNKNKGLEQTAITDEDKPASAISASSPSSQVNPAADQEKKPAPAVPAQEKKAPAPEKPVPQPKKVLQDELPVPFVADSLKTKSILAPKKNTDTIVYAELMMDGNQVGLVIEGDKPIKPKTFRLTNPDRVVLDLEGYWIFKTPQLISNRMVKDIRFNSQKEKTRIVFDLKVPAVSSMLYRIHNRKYQLVFK